MFVTESVMHRIYIVWCVRFALHYLFYDIGLVIDNNAERVHSNITFIRLLVAKSNRFQQKVKRE
jgi:hypothetical protein